MGPLASSTSCEDPHSPLEAPGQAWGALCSREPWPPKPRLLPRGTQLRGSLAKASGVLPGGQASRGSDFRKRLQASSGRLTLRLPRGGVTSSRPGHPREQDVPGGHPASIQRGLG